MVSGVAAVHKPGAALVAVADLDVKADHGRPRLGQLGLKLFRRALPDNAATAVAPLRQPDSDALVDMVGGGAVSGGAVVVAAAPSRALGCGLRIAFRERRRLALASPPRPLEQLLDLFQLPLQSDDLSTQLPVLGERVFVGVGKIVGNHEKACEKRFLSGWFAVRGEINRPCSSAPTRYPSTRRLRFPRHEATVRGFPLMSMSSVIGQTQNCRPWWSASSSPGAAAWPTSSRI